MKDVMRIAAESLIPTMETFGFRRYKRSNTFIKRHGDLYHIVDFIASRWGGSFSVEVKAWVPEVEEADVLSPHAFKRSISASWSGGLLSPRRVDDGSHSWPFGSDAQIRRALAEIHDLFIALALPWFASVTSRPAFLRVLKNRTVDEQRILDAVASDQDFGIPDSSGTHPYPWRPGELQPVAENAWLEEGEDQPFLDAGGDRLVAELESRGFVFQRAPLFRFIKQHGDIYWVICPVFTGNGIHISFLVYGWMPEVAAFYDRETPAEPLQTRLLNVNGGYLGTEGIGHGTQAWLVAGRPYVVEMIGAVIAALESVAFPYLESISSRRDFAEAILPEQCPRPFELARYILQGE